MGTSLDHHLHDGKSESLARAKAMLKDRLRQKMVQEAFDELQDTQRVVDEALDAFEAPEDALQKATAAFKQRLFDQVRRQALAEIAADVDGASLDADLAADALADVKDAFKQRLLDQVRRQAVEEVGAAVAQEALEPHAGREELTEAGDAFKGRLRDHVLQQALAEVGAEAEEGAFLERLDANALTDVKDAFKQRLLDHVFQQALAEIDAEVDQGVAAMTNPVDDSAALAQTLTENAADLYDDLSTPVERAEEPMVDVHFWEEESDPAEEVSDLSGDIFLAEEEAQDEEGPGFFLSDPNDPGNGSENASNVEAVGELADFAGDGAWRNAGPLEEFDTEAEETAPSGVFYVYGIISGADVAEEALPEEGIDPLFPVYFLQYDHIYALVSKVSATVYGKEALPAYLVDATWKEQQTQAHEAFVEGFSEGGYFLPVPFGTIYETEVDVRNMLSEISYLEALEKTKGRSQWTLKLYRNVEVLHQQVVEHSTAVQQLMSDIKSKPKGGAPSIKKQMVSAIREEEATMTDNCTKDVHERLFAHADDVELGALKGEDRRDRGKVELILEATYLVAEEKQDAFVKDVEQLVGEYEAVGFDFNVSGPSPPILFSRLHPVN